MSAGQILHTNSLFKISTLEFFLTLALEIKEFRTQEFRLILLLKTTEIYDYIFFLTLDFLRLKNLGAYAKKSFMPPSMGFPYYLMWFLKNSKLEGLRILDYTKRAKI